MPLQLKLEEHPEVVASQAKDLLASQIFSDIRILTTEGPVTCHCPIILPLSPFLNSVIASYSSFPGFVHTLVMPIRRDIVENIMTVIYTGEVTVSRENMELVYSGLRDLGICLPGLVCHIEDEDPSFHMKHEHEEVEDPFFNMKYEEVEDDEVTILENSPRANDNSINSTVTGGVPPVSSSPLSHQMIPTQLARSNLLTPTIQLPRPALPVDVTGENQILPPAVPAQPPSVKYPQFPPSAECDVPGCSDAVLLVVNRDENVNELQRDSGDGSTTEAKRMECDDDGDENSKQVSADDAHLVCLLCHAPLTSEWHRNPHRHKCPCFTPSARAADPPSPIPASRRRGRAVTAVSSPSTSADPASAMPARKRNCPLANCNKGFKYQKDLLMHLASSHYMQELLKEEFDTVEGEGESQCHRCGKILSWQGLMSHMAMKHKDVVMAYVKRDQA